MAGEGPVRDGPDLKTIREEIASRGFRLKRRWGQNFLTNRQILQFMAVAGEVGSKDLVLEIGAGPGCLTAILLDTGARVVSVEIDPKLSEIGKSLLDRCCTESMLERLVWITDDFLESKSRINPCIESALLERLEPGEGGGVKVIANLPYCIATPAILNLLEGRLPLIRMVVTIQQEVGDRFLAEPGGSAYGLVTVLASAMAKIHSLRRLPPGNFWPRPEVDSIMLKLSPLDDVGLFDDESYREFKLVARGIFAHRRKTWVKSLRIYHPPSASGAFLEAVKETGIRTDLRAQDLGINEIRTISKLFSSSRKK